MSFVPASLKPFRILARELPQWFFLCGLGASAWAFSKTSLGIPRGVEEEPVTSDRCAGPPEHESPPIVNAGAGEWKLATETLRFAAWFGGGLGVAVTCATLLIAEVAVIGSATSTPVKWDNVGTTVLWIVIAIPFSVALVYAIFVAFFLPMSLVRGRQQPLDRTRPEGREKHHMH